MPPDKGFTEESLVTDEGQCWICPSCRFVLFYVEVRVPSKTVSLEPSQQLLVTISVFPSPVPIPVRCLSTARVLPWTSPAYWGHWRLRWSGRAWLRVVCAHRDSKDRRNPGPKYGWLVVSADQDYLERLAICVQSASCFELTTFYRCLCVSEGFVGEEDPVKTVAQ